MALVAVLWRSGMLPLPGQMDPLVRRLANTPLPSAASAGWNLGGPEIRPDDDPAEGEVSRVVVHLSRPSDRASGGVGFTVFRTRGHAQANYAAATAHDQARYPRLTPEQLAKLQQSIVTPPGMTASCLPSVAPGDREAATCDALVGRTVLFLFVDGGGIDQATAFTRAFVDHAAALQR